MKTASVSPLLLAAAFLVSSASAAAIDPKDLCSYMIDIQKQTRAECVRLNAAELEAGDPSLADDVAERKAEVTRVYEVLRDDKYLEDVTDDSNTSRSSSANTDIILASLKTPLNERTFPAWFPEDDEVIRVYRLWIAGVNDQLRSEKDAVGGRDPVTPERRAEIISILVNNKAALTRLERISDLSEFSCFIGESCSGGGDPAEGIGVYTAYSVAGEDFEIGEDNRPVRLVSTAPGGSLQQETPSPARQPAGSQPVSGGEDDSWYTPAVVAVTAGLATFAAWRLRRRRAADWANAAEEVAGQDEDRLDREQRSRERQAEAEERAAAEALANAPPWSAPGIALSDLENRILNDAAENASSLTPEGLARYMETKRSYSARGSLEHLTAIDKVSNLIRGGQITFRAR